MPEPIKGEKEVKESKDVPVQIVTQDILTNTLLDSINQKIDLLSKNVDELLKLAKQDVI